VYVHSGNDVNTLRETNVSGPATSQDEQVAKTPVRGVRIDPELWKSAQATGKAQGEDVSTFIRRALIAWNTDPNATNAALANIRGGRS
jgi:hypothetical protein